MKKILLAIAFAALSMTAMRAEEKTKIYSFDDITRIEASMLYEVHITEGTSGQVKVVYEEDYEKHLRVKYIGDECRLKLQLNDIPKKFKRGHQPVIHVYIEMDRIDEIELSGAGSLIFNGRFSGSKDLDISMSGVSGISGLTIDGTDLSIFCSGSCRSEISGDFSDSVEIDFSGACKGKYNLNAKELSGELSGAAKVSIEGKIATYTEMELSGASKLDMKGSTESFEFEVSGASNIDAKDFIAQNARGILSGASQAQIHAVKSLVYESTRATRMNIYGSPEIEHRTDD